MHGRQIPNQNPSMFYVLTYRMNAHGSENYRQTIIRNQTNSTGLIEYSVISDVQAEFFPDGYFDTAYCKQSDVVSVRSMVGEAGMVTLC